MPSKCKDSDCKRTAYYNIPGEPKPLYCFEHRSIEMQDITNRRCLGEGCTKYPAFNFKGEKKCLYCFEHSLSGMINLKHVSCKFEGCNTRPLYNFDGEQKAIMCAVHKLPGMIGLKYRLCVHQGCKTRPCFNFKDETRGMYCSVHRSAEMFDIKSKKCKMCDKHPNYNFEGEKRPVYCLQHRLDGMCDVTHQKCKTYMCGTVVKDKYRGYCLFCFINTYPDEKVSRNYKTKEQSVVEYIKREFPNFTWITDKKISDGCSLRRPDLLLDLGHQVIIIEVDENQHVNYSCENKRIMELSQDVGFRPIVFIRFNPDSYSTENEFITSCWGQDKNGILVIKKQNEWTTRLMVLRDQVNYWYSTVSEKTIFNVHLFY
jgi:hypothetical protein